MYGRCRISAIKVTLIFCSILMNMQAMLLTPIIKMVQEEFSDYQNISFWSSMIIPIASLGTLCFGVLSGYLADKINYKSVLLTGLVIYNIVGPISFYLPNFSLILVFRFVLGIGTAGIITVSMALISLYFEGSEKILMMAFQAASLGIAGFFGSLLSGIISQNGWNYPFLLYHFSLIPLILVIFFIVEPHQFKKLRPAPSSINNNIEMKDFSSPEENSELKSNKQQENGPTDEPKEIINVQRTDEPQQEKEIINVQRTDEPQQEEERANVQRTDEPQQEEERINVQRSDEQKEKIKSQRSDEQKESHEMSKKELFFLISLYLISILMIQFGFFMIPPHLAQYLFLIFNADSKKVGILFGIFALLAGFLSLTYGIIKKYFTFEFISLAALMSLTIFFLFFFCTTKFPPLYCITIFGSLSLSLGMPNVPSFLSFMCPKKLQGRVMGAFNSALYIGQVTSPLIAHLILTSSGSIILPSDKNLTHITPTERELLASYRFLYLIVAIIFIVVSVSFSSFYFFRRFQKKLTK